jgi:phage baseplate assembly protein W
VLNDLIIVGNIDAALIKRVYRLLTTPAGAIPFDRNFGIDMSALDNTPSALEGALLVEYMQKLRKYIPSLRITELTFTTNNNKLIPKVVISYA